MMLCSRQTVFCFLHGVQRQRSVVRMFQSVTGSVYVNENGPVVTLFTKEGCTLCDKVKDVLKTLDHSEYPHTLEQVDINDEKEVFDKYKYDIPVLHLDHQYWTKHRLTKEEAKQAFENVSKGTFESPPGEPNAAAMER